ncbi:hydroxypyruvate isomerase family protein [Dinoroseobacter sp. S124A]|uniref:hydroxypyruvate isomerase family protein n=1 Tax=Dinoroseobacter sp. S124A TaxID=3415128 RepID=UPI003C7AD15D
MRFSANLGFLWTNKTLPEAIHAAHEAGFHAVECHWPYDTDPSLVRTALQETGLRMLGLNTRRGDVAGGENGLSALVGRETEARAAIDEAVTYATQIEAGAIHVMAGFAEGPEARRCFIENLRYACRAASEAGITILIEPLNRYDAPGYFLQTTAQASDIISEIDLPNLKLMFDCYHVQLMEGDITHKLGALQDIIGHIQFASVPDRGTPDHGELNYGHVFAEIGQLGWDMPLGAEYKPQGATEDSLGWMDELGRP